MVAVFSTVVRRAIVGHRRVDRGGRGLDRLVRALHAARHEPVVVGRVGREPGDGRLHGHVAPARGDRLVRRRDAVGGRRPELEVRGRRGGAGGHAAGQRHRRGADALGGAGRDRRILGGGGGRRERDGEQGGEEQAHTKHPNTGARRKLRRRGVAGRRLGRVEADAPRSPVSVGRAARRVPVAHGRHDLPRVGSARAGAGARPRRRAHAARAGGRRDLRRRGARGARLGLRLRGRRRDAAGPVHALAAGGRARPVARARPRRVRLDGRRLGAARPPRLRPLRAARRHVHARGDVRRGHPAPGRAARAGRSRRSS